MRGEGGEHVSLVVWNNLDALPARWFSSVYITSTTQDTYSSMPCWKQKRARYAELLSFVFPFRTSSLPARQLHVHHTCILSAPNDERGSGADVPALAERGRRRRREREAEGGVLGHGGYREQACVDMYRRTPTGLHMGAERVGGSPGARSSGSGTAEREHVKRGDDMAGEQARQVLRRLALSLSTPLPRSRSRMSVLATPFYLHQLKTVPSACAARPSSFSRRERGRHPRPGRRTSDPANTGRAGPLPPASLSCSRVASTRMLIPAHLIASSSRSAGAVGRTRFCLCPSCPPLLVSQPGPDAGQNSDLLDVLGEKMVHEGRGGRAADRPMFASLRTRSLL
jgi:hypothetical protein